MVGAGLLLRARIEYRSAARGRSGHPVALDRQLRRDHVARCGEPSRSARVREIEAVGRRDPRRCRLLRTALPGTAVREASGGGFRGPGAPIARGPADGSRARSATRRARVRRSRARRVGSGRRSRRPGGRRGSPRRDPSRRSGARRRRLVRIAGVGGLWRVTSIGPTTRLGGRARPDDIGVSGGGLGAARLAFKVGEDPNRHGRRGARYRRRDARRVRSGRCRWGAPASGRGAPRQIASDGEMCEVDRRIASVADRPVRGSRATRRRRSPLPENDDR